MLRLLLASVALALSGCASAPAGVIVVPGELETCAQTQQCLLMTPQALQRFYDLANQAGREYERGRLRGKEDMDENGPAPWQLPEFFQRAL